LSEFHLEAAIAGLHCAAPTYEETDWAKIPELYDSLYKLKPSPVIALNRAIALGKAKAANKGLAELRKIPDSAKLRNYPFYPAAEAEFLLLSGFRPEAAKHFENAIRLARSEAEKKFSRAS
jgi:RNA polymerase sigma-70 factor, ECF subfamily